VEQLKAKRPEIVANTVNLMEASEMKVGIEICHGFIDDIGYDDFVTAFNRVKAFGFDGMYYKSPQYLSESLDSGKLKAVRQYANELDLYLEMGLGRVNPYNTNETPKVWLLGNGDYHIAVEKIIQAAATIDCHELIGVTAGWKGQYSGYFCFDRFRTDVTWEDQLLATIKFLKSISPTLRECGSRINLETHEEITSFEILRIIEEVGDDVVGVALDTANVLSRGEDPLAAAIRVAPYCHQSHAKDAILFFSENGIVRQIRPCGEGIVNWKQIIPILIQHNPNINLTIEDHKGYMAIDLFREEWRSAHPDFNLAEMSELIRLARECDIKLRSGEIENVEKYEAIPYQAQMQDRLRSSLEYLKQVVAEQYG
jgi:sugar phosphate isomerase/epimerase